MLTWETLVLLTLTSVGALWVLLQLLLFIRAVSAKQLHRGIRALALLPPLVPLIAWRAGSRFTVLLWVAMLLLYGALYVLT